MAEAYVILQLTGQEAWAVVEALEAQAPDSLTASIARELRTLLRST